VSALRRTDKRDDLALVPPVDPEVLAVNRDNPVLRIELAHADEAEIRKVGCPVRVPLGQSRKMWQVILRLKCQFDQAGLDQLQHNRRALEMERRLGENGLAAQQRLGQTRRHADGPAVVPIVPIGERDNEARVGNPLHRLENPLRLERSRAPEIDPARCMNGRRWPPARARSS